MGSSESCPVVGRCNVIGGLTEEKFVYVEGTVPPDARRFAIDLVCEDKKNIAFHFNPRFDDVQMVVCNTKQNGCWGTEERNHHMPFQPGDSFEMAITVKERCYQVSLDNKDYLEYRHRLNPSRIQTVQVKGDICLRRFRVLAIPSYTPESSSKVSDFDSPPKYDEIIKAPLPDNISPDLYPSLPDETNPSHVLVEGNFSQVTHQGKTVKLSNSMVDVAVQISPDVNEEQVSVLVGKDGTYRIEINNNMKNAKQSF